MPETSYSYPFQDENEEKKHDWHSIHWRQAKIHIAEKEDEKKRTKWYKINEKRKSWLNKTNELL